MKVAMTVALTSSVQPSAGAATTADGADVAGRAASVLDEKRLLEDCFQPFGEHRVATSVAPPAG